MLRRGSRAVMWNLADVVRLAAPSWKDDVIDLAEQVAESARSIATTDEADEAEHPFSPASVVVLVWPAEKIRAVPFLVEEPLAPGLHLFYGLRGGGQIRNVKAEELVEHSVSMATLRAHAVTNLGLTLESLDVGPLFDGAPILTNHEGSLVASSLFADPMSPICERDVEGRKPATGAPLSAFSEATAVSADRFPRVAGHEARARDVFAVGIARDV